MFYLFKESRLSPVSIIPIPFQKFSPWSQQIILIHWFLRSEDENFIPSLPYRSPFIICPLNLTCLLSSYFISSLSETKPVGLHTLPVLLNYPPIWIWVQYSAEFSYSDHNKTFQLVCSYQHLIRFLSMRFYVVFRTRICLQQLIAALVAKSHSFSGRFESNIDAFMRH